jgi:putative flavoprotein involved in K+ transport
MPRALAPSLQVADWLEAYGRAMDLDVALSTRVTSAVPPAESGSSHGRWTVHVEQEGEALEAVLRPAHVVFATGMSYPNVPEPPGRFDGECLHSSAYPGAGGGRFAGRRAVVVGSNTSAHDICQDLVRDCRSNLEPESPRRCSAHVACAVLRSSSGSRVVAQ